eukprot:1001305-Amorphochlora_amoeboformis.AAC.2
MALGSGSSGAETKCKLNKTETEATLAHESRRILQRFIEKQKYSELWTSPKPTTRKREAWELKTMVYGNISLEKVLEGFYPPPLDLASFANFCQKHHIEVTGMRERTVWMVHCSLERYIRVFVRVVFVSW